MSVCIACLDTGHVCENHSNRQWPDVCDCGAGMPCLLCTTSVPQDGTHSILDNFIPRARKH